MGWLLFATILIQATVAATFIFVFMAATMKTYHNTRYHCASCAEAETEADDVFYSSAKDDS